MTLQARKFSYVISAELFVEVPANECKCESIISFGELVKIAKPAPKSWDKRR